MDTVIKISDEKTRELVEEKIIKFNHQQVPFTQQEVFIQLSFHILGNNNEVVAGINALLYCWGVVFIDVLFVDADYRKQQLGSKLLAKVEQQAKNQGATLVHLDTFDWQAKDFYIKNGYEVFGTLDNCPNTHQRFFMKKNLN